MQQFCKVVVIYFFMNSERNGIFNSIARVGMRIFYKFFI